MIDQAEGLEFIIYLHVIEKWYSYNSDMVNKYRVVVLAVIIILASSIKTSTKNQKSGTQTVSSSAPAPLPPTPGPTENHQNDQNKSKVEGPKAAVKVASSAAAKTSKQPKTALKKVPPKTPSKTIKTPNKPVSVKKPAQNKKQTTASAYANKSFVPNDNTKVGIETQKSAEEEGPIHNFWILFFSYLCIFIVMGVGYVYAYLPNTNFAQLIIDIMIFIASSLKPRGKMGYTPSVNHQEIDDSNSIAVGYTEQNGKHLFWEKNSVEGI